MLEEIPFDQRKNRMSVKAEQGDKKRAAANLVNSQVNLFECEQLSEKAVELIFNNKINAKNAFDVNVDYLDKLPHLLKKNEETSWQKASASLDASAKIYGYRVDSVHSETYKILGGLSRADNKEGEENAGEEKKEKRERRHDGFSTLEKDVKKLDLDSYDLEFEVDPLFKSMTAKFAESGARGLLLNNLPLDENLDVLLESKNNNLQESSSAKHPISHDLSNEVRLIIENSLTHLSINDVKSIQICPDLSYFKKSRDLETTLEKTFYHNLMQEFDESMLVDRIMDNRNQNGDDSIHIDDDGLDNDNLDNFSIHSHQTNSNDDSVNNDHFDMNLNMLGLSNTLDSQKLHGLSSLEGFSYLRSDDIKEYIQNFGDGSRTLFKNLPNYQNFTKTFTQIDRLKTNAGVQKEVKKAKKEEALFTFSVENEVGKSEVFEKESKVKKFTKESKNLKMKGKAKKKLRGCYYYDPTVLHTLFTNPDKRIRGFYQEEHEGDMINDNIGDVDAYSAAGDLDENMQENANNNIINLDNKTHPETFAKINNEYEKKFGRLYKTFDVRVIKNKIWESISDFNKNILPTTSVNATKASTPVDFRKIIESVSNNLSRDVLDNISTSTCFVCLLHLSNEKNLVLDQVDENYFVISTESK